MTFGDIARAKYVLLTTFRKDGTPVPTPLWVAPDGDAAVVWTVTDSWKVKRIRRNPQVTVARCDARGRAKGEPVAARAEILDEPGSEQVRRLIVDKYGIFGWLTVKGSVLRRGRTGTVGIRIAEAPTA
ncbi:PPOX class F420-dependent oxidoreductase [Rhodococcus sp. HNM0569]|uniref:PPOX class F420-dependent oxidoreductase n=1 Tax=Rhodococcus sp. HNM0569 TaxID=2716340 RepID=UPI00146CE647|nr:PPOX class F420-dependent oxidoreductase [Rhodococcus sp. HNM0569]NLU84936.1 PPOX class F420-dependent oxidoreductase [Rhodococcus sp. HNM0569]